MNLKENLKEQNCILRKSTGFTADGLLGSIAAAIFAPEGYKMTTFLGTAITHQILHNLIDHPDEDNIVSTLDKKIPTVPLDGIITTVVAYKSGGLGSALGFGIVHGPLHNEIAPKNQ